MNSLYDATTGKDVFKKVENIVESLKMCNS